MSLKINVKFQVAQVRKIQPAWKYEWKKPSQLIDQQLLNVRQVIPGPFISPRLIKISPFIIQSVTKFETGESRTGINEKKFFQGIPDPLQEICTECDKNSTEYMVGVDNINITKAILKIGVPFEQGIPNPWKPNQFIKIIDKNQSHLYNIQTNDSSNKTKSKIKRFLRAKNRNNSGSNSCEPKIRDKNFDKLKDLSNDSQNENYLDNSQVNGDTMNLICCQCNYSYLKFGKFHEHQEQRHEDDNCKSPNAGARKIKNSSKNVNGNIAFGWSETCISRSQSIGEKCKQFYLANPKTEKSVSSI